MSALELRRDESPPFLVKLFYRTGAFHRPDEFTTPELPPHLAIHTWKNCTLTELSHHMVDTSPAILPNPAIGTRLSFRLIYADTRARMDQPPRYVAKDLGSLVLGGGGPGAGPDEGVPDQEEPRDDGAKTLSDARFVTGDFISCAILPPNELTGEVAPASSARMGRGAGVGEARGLMDAPPPPPPPPPPRHRDYGPPPGNVRGRGGWRGGARGYGGGRYRERDGQFGRGGGWIPEGEWRRGFVDPDEPQDAGRWGR